MPDKRKYSDRAAYLKRAVALRRKKIKALVVKYKGGRCQNCGYLRSVDALELHHVDSSKKTFGISGQGLTRSWKRVKNEADKCVLLCANCHREFHAGIVRLPIKSPN
jgi:5-methylcytosine-specific restriction endonuclease McrA